MAKDFSHAAARFAVGHPSVGGFAGDPSGSIRHRGVNGTLAPGLVPLGTEQPVNFVYNSTTLAPVRQHFFSVNPAAHPRTALGAHSW